MRESKAELRDKILRLEFENARLTMLADDQNALISKLRADNHTCDGYCEGCEHLIQPEQNTNPYVLRITEYPNPTKKLCALDRKCKGYKAKENENE